MLCDTIAWAEQRWIEALHINEPAPLLTHNPTEYSLPNQSAEMKRQPVPMDEETIAPVGIHSVAISHQPPDSPDSFAVIGDIYTDNDRTRYGDEIAAILDQVKQIIQYAGDSTIQLEAHCDDRQSSAYSLIIGEQRARQLAGVLHMMNVEEDRVHVASYGHERPSCKQWTANCWEDNLRMQHIFKALASKEPHDGCFVRINITDNEDIVHYVRTTPASAFLKKIHLAEPAGRVVGMHPRSLSR